MSQAGLVDIETANPQIPTTFDTDSGSAIPIANVLEVFGSTVSNAANAQPVFTTGSGNTVTIEVQVGTAITGAPGDTNDAGFVSFDDTAFSVDANGYVTLIGGGNGVETVTGDDAVAISPDGVGNINFNGTIVSNATFAKPLYFDGDEGSNLQELKLQVSTAISSAPGDTNDAGISSFDDAQFTVDANGFVQLVGGTGAGAIMTNQGDDGVDISPDGSGIFYWIGSTVANATHAKPVYFKDSATANAIDLDVQVATERTGAPGDKNDAGLCSFDDTQFAVDADGYVTLVGGSGLPSIQTLTSSDPTAVGPDGSGNITLTTEAVANATNATPMFIDAGVNALNWELQVSAAITGAPGDKNDAGICSFDDTVFTVDADGYVGLATTGVANTITGDSGGALSPVSNNWNILGGPGVTTSGSGATLTINSVVYTDEGGTTSVTADSGSMSTAAITLTLPAAPANGTRCEFIASTADQLTISAPGTAIIRIGSSASSAGGSAASNAQGDALCLIYQSSTDDWFSISTQGTFTLS